MRAPSPHARGGLDVGGVGGHPARAAGDRGQGVDDEDLAGARRVAALVEEVALGADGDHGAHGVEEVGQQQGEDEQDDADRADLVQGAQEAELPEREIGRAHV